MSTDPSIVTLYGIPATEWFRVYTIIRGQAHYYGNLVQCAEAMSQKAEVVGTTLARLRKEEQENKRLRAELASSRDEHGKTHEKLFAANLEIAALRDEMQEGTEAMSKAADDYATAHDLIEILQNHCGEAGDSEGAVETLHRLIRERDILKANIRGVTVEFQAHQALQTQEVTSFLTQVASAATASLRAISRSTMLNGVKETK